jgi:hypothetical protein
MPDNQARYQEHLRLCSSIEAKVDVFGLKGKSLAGIIVLKEPTIYSAFRSDKREYVYIAMGQYCIHHGTT